MAQQQKRYLEPIKYKVGEDIPHERFTEILEAVTNWFVESRSTEEPASTARQLLQQCLDGTKKDGTPWFAAANVPFEKRVKIKCRFDVEKMEPIRTANEKKKERRLKDRQRERRKKAVESSNDDPRIPEELREELKQKGAKKTVHYGENPHILLSTAEKRRWQEVYEGYVQEFPELTTVNAEAELRLLCDLHIAHERQRLNVLSGKGGGGWSTIGREMQDLKKALGIHPDQLAKRVKPKQEATIAAAVDRLETMGDWRMLRHRFWLEELIQIWQMFMTPSADGLSYQLDEVGLFGLTRSRRATCPKCGQEHFDGLAIEEIEAYLVEKGVLEPLPEKEGDEDAATAQATNDSGDSPVLEEGSGGIEGGVGGDASSNPDLSGAT